MDLCQAARNARPGTAWNLLTHADGTQVLQQAVDGTPRVSVPTQAELNAVIASSVPVPVPPPTDAQLSAIWAWIAANPGTAMPPETSAVLSQVTSTDTVVVAASPAQGI